jgi:hypothetical protein
VTTQEARRLLELEEVLGDLRSIEITEIGLIAVIGKVSVLLPEELAGRLQGLGRQKNRHPPIGRLPCALL